MLYLLYNNSLCNLSSSKIQLLMILKKSLLTELEKKKKKIFRKAIIFLGVGLTFSQILNNMAQARGDLREVVSLIWLTSHYFQLREK